MIPYFMACQRQPWSTSIIAALPDWWGGRDLTPMLPKLFLNHFYDTSFVIESRGRMIGFLIGFLSPSIKKEAYVHFMGIHPDFRKKGLGKILYKRFFEICRKQNRMIVRACTSPVNAGSIAFHRKIGFQIETGDDEAQTDAESDEAPGEEAPLPEDDGQDEEPDTAESE